MRNYQRLMSSSTPHPSRRCAPIHLLPQGEKVKPASTSARNGWFASALRPTLIAAKEASMTIHSISAKRATHSAEARVAAQDWHALVSELNAHGSAVMPALLSPQECAEIAGLYPH